MRFPFQKYRFRGQDVPVISRSVFPAIIRWKLSFLCAPIQKNPPPAQITEGGRVARTLCRLYVHPTHRRADGATTADTAQREGKTHNKNCITKNIEPNSKY